MLTFWSHYSTSTLTVLFFIFNQSLSVIVSFPPGTKLFTTFQVESLDFSHFSRVITLHCAAQQGVTLSEKSANKTSIKISHSVVTTENGFQALDTGHRMVTKGHETRDMIQVNYNSKKLLYFSPNCFLLVPSLPILS